MFRCGAGPGVNQCERGGRVTTVPGGELSYDLWGHGGRALRSPDGPDGLGARATQSPVREDERVKLLRDRDQDVLYARPSVALPFELASNASPGVPGSTCDAR